MMRSPFTWEHGLISEINEKIVLFQDSLDIMRKYQHTVVLSCFMRDNLLTNGFSPANLHVIPPYIFIPKTMPSHKNTPLPMILFVGQLNNNANAKTFVNVLSKLRQPFQATIIGDGKDKPALEKLVRKKGLEAKVTFKGLSNPEEYFPLADLSLIPISDKEPYSLAVAECAAWGLPVVSSPSKGLEEALQDGITGFTASNRDIKAMTAAVEKLLGAPELRQELGTNGYNLVKQNFAEDELVRKFKKLLTITP
ncbi:MAG: glycosyltransferase family 4 protein [Victivallales bacterium]|nr:glycosyltransferase family 4 protein [Victivallales bacterium]